MRHARTIDGSEASVVRRILIAVIIIVIVASSVYTVGAGHRGVLLTFGKPSLQERQEGFGLKIPIAQKVVKMEVRTQKMEVQGDSSSKDLQDVETNVALNYHVEPSMAAELYQGIGLDYNSRIIEPAIQESLKSISAMYTAEELITERTEVRNELQEALRERLLKSNIIVDDLNIVNFQFSEEFDKAIEAKVTAEQLKLKAERDLERIIIEKEQLITTAEAQAQALSLQKAEVTEELIRLREVENQKMAIEKWDGILPHVTGGAVPFISIE